MEYVIKFYLNCNLVTNTNLKDVFNIMNKLITKRMTQRTLLHIHERIVLFSMIEKGNFNSYSIISYARLNLNMKLHK